MWTTPCFKHPLLAGQPRMITIRVADGCRWVILTRKHGFRGHQWWEAKGIFDDAICVSTILARKKVKTIQKRQCHCPVQVNKKTLDYGSLHISILLAQACVTGGLALGGGGCVEGFWILDKSDKSNTFWKKVPTKFCRGYQ